MDKEYSNTTTTTEDPENLFETEIFAQRVIDDLDCDDNDFPTLVVILKGKWEVLETIHYQTNNTLSSNYLRAWFGCIGLE